MNHDDPKLFDVRTLERKMRKGLMTKKDYDKHLKALPDSASRAVAAAPGPGGARGEGGAAGARGASTGADDEADDSDDEA